MNEADWWAGTEGERKSGNGAGGRNGAPPASFCGGRVVESRFSGKTGVALSLRGTLFGPLRLRAARLVRAMSIDRSGCPPVCGVGRWFHRVPPEYCLLRFTDRAKRAKYAKYAKTSFKNCEERILEENYGYLQLSVRKLP